MNTLLLEEEPANPKHLACSWRKCTSAGLGLFGFAFAVILGMILATVADTPVSGPLASRPTVLLVGDSITQLGSSPEGWATRLQASYIRSVDVINRGLSGYSTRTFRDKGLFVVSRELETSFAPVLITLWFGANDMTETDGPEGKKHVPLNEYRSNLVSILNEFHRVAPQAKILVIAPPVVDDDMRRSLQIRAGGNSDPIDRTNAQASLYATACGGVVQVLDDDRVMFLNMHSYMMTAYGNATARAALFADGLHLSAEGNHVVFDQVRNQMQLLLPSSVLETSQIPII